MKKEFVYFLIAWIIGLFISNVAFFVLGFKSSLGLYWPGYIACLVAYFVLLFCAYIALNQKTVKETINNAPLITISYGCLSSIFSLSLFYAFRKYLDNWIGILALVLSVGYTLIKVIGVKANADIIKQQDLKTERNISFMKEITSSAENLFNKTADKDLKSLCKKVFEALRYTDPVSNETVHEIDEEIDCYFKEFQRYIEDENYSEAKYYEELIAESISERAIKLKKTK